MSANDNVRGTVLMVLGAGTLLLNDAVTKLLTESYPLGQVLCLRQLAATVPILLYVHFGPGWAMLRARDVRGQAVRAGCFLATVWLMVFSLALLPLPVVTAIAFSSPVFVAALSVPILGERVGWRRWLAILAGFAGVLVIVRPGGAAFMWIMLVPVAAAIAAGLRDLVTRRLSRRDNSLATLFWSSIVVIAATTPTAALGWNPVPVQGAALFVLSGLLNAAAHFLMIEALRLGQAAVVSPFRYSALIWSVLMGFLIWGDLPSWWTVAGMAIIFASGIYMARRGTS